MTNTTFLQKKSVATQLIKIVFGFYCVIAILITVTQIIIEYQYTEQEIQDELSINQQIFEPVLSASLWNLDKEQIQNTINGMLAIPIINGIKIEQKNTLITAAGVILQNENVGNFNKLGMPVEADASMPSDLFSYQFPINYQFRGEPRLVGVATIYSSANVVIDRVKMGIILLIINSILKTIALWVVFFWVSKRILLNPLNNLVDTINNINFKKLDNVKIDLKNKQDNELTIIESAFSTMINKLATARKEVLNSHLILEDKVKQRTAELELAKAEAELANKTKTEFMSRISHEFNTPLNAIVGGSDVLLSLTPEAQTDNRYMIDNIKVAGKHLTMLVKDIMDMVQSSKNEFKVALQNCLLNNIIESCISMIKPMAEQKNITIFYIPQQVEVFANEGRIRQIILHLLTNAVLYNKPDGNIEITINASDLQFVVVKIEDSGVGIKATDLDRVFLPFTRLDYPIKQCIDGLGIGLSLSKTLIEHMDGKISVNSTEEVGSTFVVSFLAAKHLQQANEAEIKS
jgi:signal transduction histidine kinase